MLHPSTWEARTVTIWPTSLTLYVLGILTQDLKEGGILENTIVIFAADHSLNQKGIDTYPMRYEQNLPHASVILPESFKKRYPEAARNLKFNAQYRLTSSYDIHKTLLAATTGNFVPNSGINSGLFEKIPEARTCDEAKINPAFCSCGKVEKLDRGDIHVINAKEVFTKFVTNFTAKDPQSFKCAKVNNFEIEEAAVKVPSQDLTLFLRMTPYSAVLKVVYRIYDKITSSVKIIEIERTDLYAPMTKCLEYTQNIENAASRTLTGFKLELFCICKDVARMFLN